MSSPVNHAQSSARLFGGHMDNYIELHCWFDETKEHFPNFRHRAVRHHSTGIVEAERVFERYFTVTLDSGRARRVAVRQIGEQHCVEDCGFVPTLADWLGMIQPAPWMTAGKSVRARRDPIAAANR